MSGREYIPLSTPNISGNELKYVSEVIEKQWVSTAGLEISKFENLFKDYLSVKGTCACQSGTAGLHLAIKHYGIAKDDIVLVPTLTFIATIEGIIYENASPVFFDADKNLCINTEQLLEYIETDCCFDGKTLIEKDSGKTVKAIIPVHIFGDYCNMDAIMDISQKYNLIIIEDAAESLGTKFSSGRFKGQYTGTVGNCGVISFNGNKLITTGGGGMIVSNDISAVEHMRYLSQQAKDNSLYFEHNEIGFNYRMTNLQAALGIGQFEVLEKFIEAKRKNYLLYSKLLEDCTFGYLHPFQDVDSCNCWFYTFLLNEADAQKRDKIISYLEKNKIQSRPIWKLNHLQKPLSSYRHMDIKNAEDFYNRAINLPCSTNISSNDIEYICDILLKFEN